MIKMNILKKRIFAAVFASAIIISNAMCVLAASPQPATARPRPGTSSSAVTETTAASSESDKDEKKDEEKDEKTTKVTTSSSSKSSSSKASESEDTDEEDTKNEDTKNTKINVSTVAPAAETPAPMAAVSEKKYTTKGGAFGWFILSVIVNAVLSFAIANRFYKMSKKDNHIASEIRALRRDVEERFASTVNGFYEQETDMVNQNDDYSSELDGIKMKERVVERDETAEEIFRKWESDLANQRIQKRAEIRANIKPRSEEEAEAEEMYSRTKSYQPRRQSDEDLYMEEDDDLDYEDYEKEEEGRFAAFKNKAKEFITDVFPLKED